MNKIEPALPCRLLSSFRIQLRVSHSLVLFHSLKRFASIISVTESAEMNDLKACSKYATSALVAEASY